MLLSGNYPTQPESEMADQNASSDAIAAAIESATDGQWGVWLSDTGWWWAARTRALSAHDLAAGCQPYLHADNPDELAERIQQQERLLPDTPPAQPASAGDHHGPAAAHDQPGQSQDGRS